MTTDIMAKNKINSSGPRSLLLPMAGKAAVRLAVLMSVLDDDMR